MQEIIYASAVELGKAIHKGDVSSLEVTQAHLQRIREVNPRLNAVFHIAEESAIKAAKEADEATRRGDVRGPLHGVPVTIKDWIEVAGMPCVAGDEKYLNHIPTEDATVVQRLRDAGCILLGKTTVTDNSEVYGRVFNPYRLDRSPAGSSSGEAAIIAAGGSPLGLGSDSGGSIREPAHNCGIAGLRPTTGRFPITGHLPRINTFVDPRTVIGPMARFVEDLAVTLPLLSGIDWRDPSAVAMPLQEWKSVNLSHLKGAFYIECSDAEPSRDCAKTARLTAKAFEGGGIRMDEACPPRLDEVWPITKDYWSRAGSEGLEDEWRPDSDSPMTGTEVERHLFQWDRFRRTLMAFMQSYDFILTPAAANPAQPHEGGKGGGISYTLPYSLTGYPSIVVRAGTSEDGLPIGVQIVGRPWGEDVILAVAHHVEHLFGGWQRPEL